MLATGARAARSARRAAPHAGGRVRSAMADTAAAAPAELHADTDAGGAGVSLHAMFQEAGDKIATQRYGGAAARCGARVAPTARAELPRNAGLLRAAGRRTCSATWKAAR